MIMSAQPISYTRDTFGTSIIAQEIMEVFAQIRDRFQESIALGLEGKGVFGELDAVYAECSQPNWDGYGALPVLPETYSNARDFLESLRLGVSAPSVGAEPDGHLTLEWYNARRKTLSVSIAPAGDLYFAAIIGPRTRYGSEPLGTAASEIEDLIHKVTTD